LVSDLFERDRSEARCPVCGRGKSQVLGRPRFT